MACSLLSHPLSWQASNSEVNTPTSFEDSVGELVSLPLLARLELKGIKFWRPRGVVSETFQEIYPIIVEVVKTHLESRPRTEDVVLGCYMLGYSSRTAVPYISFASRDQKYRRELRKLVQNEVLKKYPGWKSVDWNQDPGSRNMTTRGNMDHDALNVAPVLQIKSSTSSFGGSKIFVRKNETDEIWKHVATGGGIITNGKGSYFLMTAAHSLPGYEGPSFPPPQSLTEFEFNMDDLSDDVEPDELGVESTSLGSRTPTETRHSSPNELSPHTSQSEEIISREQSFLEENIDAILELPLPTSTIDQQTQGLLTQEHHPPLYTMYSKPPSITSSESSHPGLDYALIGMNRIEPHNETRSLETTPLGVLYKLEPREVVVTTSSHSRIKGRLLETPFFIIRSDTTESQELWTVVLENDTIEGDSGSWVLDATNGEMIGHIVAASTETGSTFIVPAFQVLEDLHRRLDGSWWPITYAHTPTPTTEQSPAQQNLTAPSTLTNSSHITAIGASDDRNNSSKRRSTATARHSNQVENLELAAVSDTIQLCNYHSKPSTSSQFHSHPLANRLIEMPRLSCFSSTGSSWDTNLSSDYNTTASGQSATPNESYNQDTMYDPSSYHTPALSAGLTNMHGESIKEESVDMADELTFATGFISPKKAPGIIDQVNKYLPPAQNKRSWSRHQMQSDNEEEDIDSQRRKKGTAITDTPVSALNIAQATRKLKDSDFEASMEWCPFYLNEPFKFFPKPWTSCTRPRAEISHIITHMISDHGMIRGNSSKRKSQRYLTRCNSHDDTRKGKSNCTTCSQVEHWSLEQIKDQKHTGPSLCLRCYTKLKTKEDLYQHLHKTNICVYHEDLPMIQKARILYTIFCSATEVPKFNPPPETRAPRDGARKRNMKARRRTGISATKSQNNGQVSTEPLVQASLRQSHLPLPPAPNLSLISNGGNSELSEDRSNNLFSTTHPKLPLQIKQPRQHTQPIQFPQLQLPTLVHRQPVPSRISDFDLDLQSYPSFTQTCHMTHCENLPSLHATTLDAQSIQPLSMHLGGNKYSAYDSGIGSDMGGIQSQPAYDDHPYPPDDTYNIPPNKQQQYFCTDALMIPPFE